MAARKEVLRKVWRYRTNPRVRSRALRSRTFITATQTQNTRKERFESPTVRLKRFFQVLGLEQDECTEEEIRRSYIRLAKQYHPDSSSSQADADRFSEVREAYKKCMSYAKNVSMTRDILEALEQELADLDKHLGYTVSKQRRLAHRQYLSYDVGTGTLSQRQRAHAQQRVNEAIDNVFEKQFQKALENPDVKEVAPYEGGKKAPGNKSTKSLQRIANEIIYDSMKRGEFDNLKGQGKPLNLDPINPVLDNVEQKINKMLSNSGFAPEWISLDKEIRTGIDRLQADLVLAWNKCGPTPMMQERTKLWEIQLSQFRESVKAINKKIFDLNLIVPSLHSQRSPLSLERLLSKVMETCPTYIEVPTEDIKREKEDDPLGSLYAKTVDVFKRWYGSMFSS